jgi:L-iditol 2-dehydrogenase
MKCRAPSSKPARASRATRWASASWCIITFPAANCYYCRKQTPTQCELYKKVGVTAGFEPSGGGFAEYIRVMDWIVEGRGVVRIPDGVPFEQAAFVEPLNTVLKGVKLLNLAADDTVLVIGQGPIGLMHARWRAPGRKGAHFRSLSRAPRNCGQVRAQHPIHAGSENVVRRSSRDRRRGARCW